MIALIKEEIHFFARRGEAHSRGPIRRSANKEPVVVAFEHHNSFSTENGHRRRLLLNDRLGSRGAFRTAPQRPLGVARGCLQTLPDSMITR